MITGVARGGHGEASAQQNPTRRRYLTARRPLAGGRHRRRERHRRRITHPDARERAGNKGRSPSACVPPGRSARPSEATGRRPQGPYTPPWKYKTTWSGSTPSMAIRQPGTPPSRPGSTSRPRRRWPRRCPLLQQPPLLTDVAVNGDQGPPQGYKDSPTLPQSTEDLPSVVAGQEAHQVVRQVSACSSCWARASTRLVAGGVSRRHWITVIRLA